jgi:hypothetical protein
MLVIAAALTVAALSISRLGAKGAAGCAQAAEGSITESESFTPYEDMISPLPPAALNPAGADVPNLPADARLPADQLDGLPLQWAVVAESGAVYQYFTDKPISMDVTTDTFVAAGGVEFDRDPPTSLQPLVESVLAELGDRAVKVSVRDHDGALVWADPNAAGIRTHNLYWSDGKFNYSLIADRSPAKLLNTGRDLVSA